MDRRGARRSEERNGTRSHGVVALLSSLFLKDAKQIFSLASQSRFNYTGTKYEKGVIKYYWIFTSTNAQERKKN